MTALHIPTHTHTVSNVYALTTYSSNVHKVKRCYIRELLWETHPHTFCTYRHTHTHTGKDMRACVRTHTRITKARNRQNKQRNCWTHHHIVASFPPYVSEPHCCSFGAPLKTHTHTRTHTSLFCSRRFFPRGRLATYLEKVSSSLGDWLPGVF